MQKAAFQALQLQKDAVHGYIRNQVGDDVSLFFLFVFLFCFVLFLQLVSARGPKNSVNSSLRKKKIAENEKTLGINVILLFPTICS